MIEEEGRLCRGTSIYLALLQQAPVSGPYEQLVTFVDNGFFTWGAKKPPARYLSWSIGMASPMAKGNWYPGGVGFDQDRFDGMSLAIKVSKGVALKVLHDPTQGRMEVRSASTDELIGQLEGGDSDWRIAMGGYQGSWRVHAPQPVMQPFTGEDEDDASGAQAGASASGSGEDVKPDLDSMTGTAIRWAAGADGYEKAAFRDKVPNKFAITIMPSIDMHMDGQRTPSSGHWFNCIEASDQMRCQYALLGRNGSLDALRREQIFDRDPQSRGSSFEQLEYLARHHLPNAMRFNDNPIPTSLWLIAHGTPGHVCLGGEMVSSLQLVRYLVDWSGRSGCLQHVHLEACSALQGVTSDDKRRIKVLKDVVITGYDAKVATYGVDVSQRFGSKLMHAMSITAAIQRGDEWEELNCERLWAKVKVELDSQVGQASRGAPVSISEADTLKAFKVI